MVVLFAFPQSITISAVGSDSSEPESIASSTLHPTVPLPFPLHPRFPPSMRSAVAVAPVDVAGVTLSKSDGGSGGGGGVGWGGGLFVLSDVVPFPSLCAPLRRKHA